MSVPFRLIGATVTTVGTALGLALTAGPALAAASPATSDPAPAAAGWLARQLTGAQQDHLTSSYVGQDGKTVSYDDQGLTADAVLGFDAAGVAQDAAARATTWLAGQVGAYAGTAPNYYPGSLAKLILVATAQGLDPHSFGGVDLVAALTGEENAAGLYDDPDAQNGYESTVTQALAIVALSRTDTPADQAAVDWLAGQQCADGGFQTDVRADADAACASENDTTAYAVQALAAAGASGSGTGKAVDWLIAHRNADAGFGAPTSNANSTAVAVQALVATGRTPSASIAYLQSLQQGCAAPAGQQGAVTYAGTFDEAAVRATTQAAQGLAAVPLAHISATGATGAAPALSCPAAQPAAHRSADQRADTPAGSRTEQRNDERRQRRADRRAATHRRPRARRPDGRDRSRRAVVRSRPSPARQAAGLR